MSFLPRMSFLRKQESRKKELKMTDEAKLGDWEIMKLGKKFYPALYAYFLYAYLIIHSA